MKKIIFLLLSCIIGMHIGAYAQTLVTPLNSPTSIATGLAQVDGINSAMIQASSTSAGSATQIIAVVYYDAATPSNSTLYVKDINSGALGSVTLSVAPTATPDVIICNNSGATVDDYIVVVSYPDALTNTVYLEYFDVFCDGVPGNFTGPTSSSTSTFSASSALNVVHIDGIVDYRSIGTTGYPDCLAAVVVWDDAIGVYASYISNVSSPPGTLTATSIASPGYAPDIAGIRRDTTISGTPTTIDEALITYTTPPIPNGNHVLRFCEWDITNSHAHNTVVDGTTPAGSQIENPRIDALDDNYNNSFTSGNAFYKVAAHYSNGNDTIITNDNTQGHHGWEPSNVINYGSPTPPYKYGNATIALSYTGSTYEYMVAHFTDDNVSGGGNEAVMMEPIDWAAPTSITNPPNRYYWVSQYPTATSNGTYASCVSSDCNDLGTAGLVVWGMYNSSTYDIWYKITSYPYGFKHGTEPEKAIDTKMFAVYPNPATSNITVSNSSAGRYSITDMVGRTVLHGSLPKGSSTIDIRRQAPGNYIFKVNMDDGSCYTEMIVKE